MNKIEDYEYAKLVMTPGTIMPMEWPYEIRVAIIEEWKKIMPTIKKEVILFTGEMAELNIKVTWRTDGAIAGFNIKDMIEAERLYFKELGRENEFLEAEKEFGMNVR